MRSARLIGNEAIARHLVLKPARAGIGRSTEHEQALAEAIGAFDERLQRIRPHQGIDGQAVGFKVAAAAGRGGGQVGAGIGCGGGADVAALGVENDADARRPCFPDAGGERRQTRQSTRFEIGRLEFDEADASLDGLDHEIDEPLDPQAVVAEKLGNIGKRGVDAGDKVAKFRDVSLDQLNP